MKRIFLLFLIIPTLVLSQSEHAKRIFPCDETAQWLFDYLDVRLDKQQLKELRKEFKKRFKETVNYKNLHYFKGEECYTLKNSSNHYYSIGNFNIDHNDFNQIIIKFSHPCSFESLFTQKNGFIELASNAYSKYVSEFDFDDFKQGNLKRYVYEPLGYFIEYLTIGKRINIRSSEEFKNDLVKKVIQDHKRAKQQEKEEIALKLKRELDNRKKVLAQRKEDSLNKILAEELYANIKSYPYSIENNTNIDFSKPYYPKTEGRLASKLVVYGNMVIDKSIIREGKPTNSKPCAGFIISQLDTQELILKKLNDISGSLLSFKGNDIIVMAGNLARNKFTNVKVLGFNGNKIDRIKTEELSGQYISFIEVYKPYTNQEGYLSHKDNLWWTKIILTAENKIKYPDEVTVLLNKDIKLANITLPAKTSIIFPNFNDYKTLRKNKYAQEIFLTSNEVQIVLPNNSSIKGEIQYKGGKCVPIGTHIYKDSYGKEYQNKYSSILFYNQFGTDGLYSDRKHICLVQSDNNKNSLEYNFYKLDAYTTQEAEIVATKEQNKINAKVGYENSNSVAADLRRKSNSSNSATNNLFRTENNNKTKSDKKATDYGTYKTYRLTNKGSEKCAVTVRLSKGRFAYGNNTTYWVNGNSTYDIDVTANAIIYRLETLNCNSKITGEFVD